MEKNKIDEYALSIPLEKMRWFVREFDRIVDEKKDTRIVEVIGLFNPYLVIVKK